MAVSKSTKTVLILFFSLTGLIILLIFLYKKLNREADGEYTIRRMVYKEGGIRDRVRGSAIALGTCLGVQLWPSSDQDGEEMQEVQDEEGQVEEGSSQGSDSEGDDKEEEEEEEEEDSVEQCGITKGKEDDASGDASSLGGSEAGEQTRLTNESEAKGVTGEEKGGDGEGKGEASRGPGLLINLKPFSGSAIWSDDEGCEGKNNDVTAL